LIDLKIFVFKTCIQLHIIDTLNIFTVR